MTRVTLRRALMLTAIVATSALGASGCKAAGTGGQSPSYLIINALEAASGAEPEKFGTILYSDVQTFVKRTVNGQQTEVPTIFPDSGRVTFRLGLKDQGLPGSPTAPTTINEVTLSRYHVSFKRADGRNTPGVDVPYAIDGTFTATVPGGGTLQMGFDMVRHQMKEEPPLRNLVGNGGAGLITAIADVTFYGRDQVGNEVTVSGSMTVNFGDFGDPE